MVNAIFASMMLVVDATIWVHNMMLIFTGRGLV